MGKQPDIEQQLRQAIETCGMSRYRLSKITGVSDGVLANFCTGKRSLTLTTAAKLAKALGLELRHSKER
jgi:plasmid maintenance system antidote protein VapI